jgi:uncharacterized protein with gpF-like domain
MTDPRMAMEKSFAGKVFTALKTWLARVRTAVMSAWTKNRQRPDPIAVAAETPLWTRLVQGLMAELKLAADQGFSEVANAGKPLNEQFIEQQLAQSYRLMVGIPDEVQALIQREINDAVNGGDSPQRIAARVDALLDATGSARWTNRANVIATTEIHRAGQAGIQAAGMAISRLESVRLNKKWISHRDERTRQAHRDADGQIVPLNSTFLVGNDSLLYPSDPTAPPETVINCRCEMLILDAN